ncbi:Hypothetical predicted protein [Prunus dulcis]|uniref:Uncharacterized protein n=1 Tax=Prunus dulcis TaxID=3755 RepID=A0A5E4EG06_PRUDU|nr:Hypothetical predicted protein [Prunus dulcis]
MTRELPALCLNSPSSLYKLQPMPSMASPPILCDPVLRWSTAIGPFTLIYL